MLFLFIFSPLHLVMIRSLHIDTAVRLKPIKDICPCVPCCCSHAQHFVIPWTVARQSPLSMGCPSKNMGVGCHFLLQGIFPAQRSNPCLLHWQAGSLPLSRLGSPLWIIQQYSPWAVCSHYVPSTYLSCHWKLMPPLVSLLSSQRTVHVCS